MSCCGALESFLILSYLLSWDLLLPKTLPFAVLRSVSRFANSLHLMKTFDILAVSVAEVTAGVTHLHMSKSKHIVLRLLEPV